MQRISWPGPGADELYARAVQLVRAAGGRRRILGIAGAPASGKSTLAVELAERLGHEMPGAVAAVGMDAFHLSQAVLQRHGLVEVKGAPQTFDAIGYLRLLERIRHTDEIVYAPEFDRSIEDSIAHRIEIGPEVRLVVTEGNYLCLDADPWRAVHAALDQTWFVELDEPVRRQRLIERHLRYGRSQVEAEQRADGSDQRNAELIARSMLKPDVWIDQQP
ncbi:nucleoside/nucleotide kinase family protein [Microlunatus soli]|uniref:nucleoside/nucleotide kinase family protein n=1 Tax=Microlunatus soli TaxID=630515 RepID=UPI001E639B59|nr:nucleoside/nucleotide kinase family protein [Microlunatus soli]